MLAVVVRVAGHELQAMERGKANPRSVKPGPRHVALLRGINLSGHNRLAMAELIKLLEESGCADVRTYIQSGNVVFSASAGCAKRVPQTVSRLMAERFGLNVPVVLRSAEDISKVVAGNPFLKSGASADRLHVIFLADAPAKPAVLELDPNRSPGDSFHVRGRDIYVHLPNGAARTKLTNAYFDSRLKTISTMRNWRTVLKLAEMSKV